MSKALLFIPTILNLSPWGKTSISSSSSSSSSSLCFSTTPQKISPPKTTIEKVGNIQVNRVPLSRSTPLSPWCFVADLNPTLFYNELDDENNNNINENNNPNDKNDENDSSSQSMNNVLATQVWPSSRFASTQIMKSFSNLNQKKKTTTTICELGCGPGLPSLTAASTFSSSTNSSSTGKQHRVIATDVDDFALSLVSHAAKVQNLDSILTTQYFDLTNVASQDNTLPNADLYIMSDVFENEHVARGAAYHTVQSLLKSDEKKGGGNSSVFWVFAQPDRAHRRVYVEEIQRLLLLRHDENHHQDEKDYCESLEWSDASSWEEYTKKYNEGHMGSSSRWSFGYRLWLCNVDETAVQYN